MIDTLFFALQIAGVVVLIGWSAMYDKHKDGAPMRGPLAFKQNDDILSDSKSANNRLDERKTRRRRLRHGHQKV